MLKSRALALAVKAGVLTGLVIPLLAGGTALAQTLEDPLGNALSGGLNDSTVVQLLLLMTILALAPAILMCTTCFTRVIVILAFIRNAIGTPQMPPNQVLMGTALFISIFIMGPVISEVNAAAITPYREGAISHEEALDRGLGPLRDFMFRQTDKSDLALFVSLSDVRSPETPDDVSTSVLIPAFILSELKKAFIIAFIIYVPFLVIDVIVAGTLMSMGMLMLPPMMIALPFKLLLFVMVNGWQLIVKSLISSFG